MRSCIRGIAVAGPMLCAAISGELCCAVLARKGPSVPCLNVCVGERVTLKLAVHLFMADMERLLERDGVVWHRFWVFYCRVKHLRGTQEGL